MRQLLTESVMLALVGGLLGLLSRDMGGPRVALAQWRQPPAGGDIGLDAKVLGFTLLLSLVTGLIFGIMPGRSAAGADQSAGDAQGRWPRLPPGIVGAGAPSRAGRRHGRHWR